MCSYPKIVVGESNKYVCKANGDTKNSDNNQFRKVNLMRSCLSWLCQGWKREKYRLYITCLVEYMYFEFSFFDVWTRAS